MPTHSIYSVRDKKKVDAEVIDVREVSGAKGVRYQIVGRHPEDGTTVTTFCSAAVADDFRSQLGETKQHAAESVDHIPRSEATVVSTDGTPIDDDLDTFVEDPLVGSASAGTLTSAKVLAAEGELSKTSCCCGATEDNPCACMTADEPMQCSSTDPKCACYAALDAKAAEGCPCTNCGCGKAAETVAGIDIQTPSQIIIETPDSDELIVPDPDLLVNGDGNVIGQQTGKVNTTPLHAEEDDIAHASDRAEMIMQEHIEKGMVEEDEYYTLGYTHGDPQPDDDPSGFTELGREVFESFYSALVEGTDESDICYHCGSTDDVHSCWSCDVSKCIECDDDEMRSDEDGHTYCDSCGPCEHHANTHPTRCLICGYEGGSKAAESNFDNPDVRTFTPKEALEYLRSGDNTVWLIDYSDHNYGDDEYPHYDYPIEDPDELSAMIEDGVFDDHEQFDEIVIANDTSYALGMWKDQPGGKHPSYAEFNSESPVFARNKRILIPTAVIGGLALAYLAKPELLSGSFDRISDMLGKLTKKNDKTE